MSDYFNIHYAIIILYIYKYARPVATCKIVTFSIHVSIKKTFRVASNNKHFNIRVSNIWRSQNVS